MGSHQSDQKDDSSPVRAAAAKVLARDPDPAATKALAEAAGDDSWIVRAAVPCLSKLRARDFVELAICYGLIQLVIWTSKPLQHLLFWIAFTWVLATTLVYRPDANTLGLRLSVLDQVLQEVSV